MSDLKQLCIELEHFETPEWAARAILKKEILTQYVVDPCAGSGILTEAATDMHYRVAPFDIHDWGYTARSGSRVIVGDFLKYDRRPWGELPFSVFMNPPFSKATQFVKKSFELGARKIVCFQRFAWWESQGRREFWEKNPPSRVYICGDRANCWRHDIPINSKGERYDPITGKILSNSPTAHAWFIFEQNNMSGTQLLHIWKDDVA